jgi:DNA-directed RNA polymerase specialized sigma24 family protein
MEHAMQDRELFIAAAAIRRILDELAAPAPNEHLLALHDALDGLAQTDPKAATLVKLRFFGGMTTNEAAEALGMSVRSAHDLWANARSWLRRHIQPE